VKSFRQFFAESVFIMADERSRRKQLRPQKNVGKVLFNLCYDQS